MFTIFLVDDKEPDVEVWDEDEQDIIVDLSEDEQPNLDGENIQVDVVPRRSRILAVWVLRFLMIMQLNSLISCWDTF